MSALKRRRKPNQERRQQADRDAKREHTPVRFDPERRGYCRCVAQQQCVKDAERNACCSDAQTEQEHDQNGEARHTPQQAEALRHILNNSAHRQQV